MDEKRTAREELEAAWFELTWAAAGPTRWKARAGAVVVQVTAPAAHVHHLPGAPESRLWWHAEALDVRGAGSTAVKAIRDLRKKLKERVALMQQVLGADTPAPPTEDGGG